MKIRTRLSITFFTIVIVMLTASSVAVYYFAENTRKVDFYHRLKNRALNTAHILTEVKEVSASLQRRLERNNPARLPDQYIVMIDSLGKEIYRSTGPVKLTIDSSLMNDIKRNREIHITKDNREILGFIYHTGKGNYVVLATAFDHNGNESIAHLRNILLATLLASILVVLGLSWFYAGRVLEPVSKIIKEVGNISEKNLNQRLDEGDQKDELAQLAMTFNDMLSRLQSSFALQKSFIANASHEIKTPITIMSGEIEVTLLHERDNSYYTKTLRSLLQALKRLNSLSTQLLLLAESSNQNPERKFSSFRVDDVLWDTKEVLVRAFPNYQVEINFNVDLDDDAFSITGDEPLIRAAILNLMDNGCKYSPDNHVSIIVDTKTKDWITLFFVNAGTIPAGEIDKIFSPFYRVGDRNEKKGFGIGLSLVNNVVKLHGGQLFVLSKDGITEFTMKLPSRRRRHDS